MRFGVYSTYLLLLAQSLTITGCSQLAIKKNLDEEKLLAEVRAVNNELMRSKGLDEEKYNENSGLGMSGSTKRYGYDEDIIQRCIDLNSGVAIWHTLSVLSGGTTLLGTGGAFLVEDTLEAIAVGGFTGSVALFGVFSVVVASIKTSQYDQLDCSVRLDINRYSQSTKQSSEEDEYMDPVLNNF